MRPITGQQYLQALQNMKEFSKRHLQASVVLESLNINYMDKESLLSGIFTLENGALQDHYKYIFQQSPDLDFIHNSTDYEVDFIEVAPLIKEKIKTHLVQTGFHTTFNKVVITNNISKSVEKRKQVFNQPSFGQYGPIAAYYDDPPPTRVINPHLYVNHKLFKGKKRRKKEYILNHEILHCLSDHMHYLIDAKAIPSISKQLNAPKAVIGLAEMLLAEAHVECLLLEIEDEERSWDLVSSDIPVLMSRTEFDLPGQLKRLGDPRKEEKSLKALRVMSFNALACNLGSYLKTGKRLPKDVNETLEGLPKNYRNLFKELSRVIPSILEDMVVERDEIVKVVKIIKEHEDFMEDFKTYCSLVDERLSTR